MTYTSTLNLGVLTHNDSIWSATLSFELSGHAPDFATSMTIDLLQRAVSSGGGGGPGGGGPGPGLPPGPVSPPTISEPPISLTAPTVTGVAQVGSSLIATQGTWAAGGNTPSSLSNQWQSSPDNATWSNISGATALTYSPVTGDVGNYIRFQVVAINTDGTAIGLSTSVGPVTPSSAPSGVLGTPVVGGLSTDASAQTADGGSSTASAQPWFADGGTSDGVSAPVDGGASTVTSVQTADGGNSAVSPAWVWAVEGGTSAGTS